jgi:hypothetical protein
MHRILASFLVAVAIWWVGGCAAVVSQGSGNHPSPQPQNPIGVTITDKFANEFAGGPVVTLNAIVTNDPANLGVTWSLTAGGANCAPACGSLTPSASPSFSATYSPPASVPATPNNTPTITATSVADKSKSDSFTFSLSFTAGVVVGNYAFLLRGFGPNGVPVVIAGTVDLDPTGNITGGQLDINVGGQITSMLSALAGNYLVDTSFNGIKRGTINITNSTLPGTSSNLAMKCAISADGKRGKVIEFDGSGFKSSGTLLQQDSKSITATIPTGNFAFGLDSDSASGIRVVEAGQFSLGAAGVTGGLVDQSQAENANPIYSAVPIQPGAATPPDAFGRGTLTLTVGGNATQYAYYVVNSGQFFLIQIDSGQTFGTVQAGVARLQNPLTTSGVSATSVVQMTGIDKAYGTQNLGPAVIAGVMTISGGSALNLTFDANDAGTVLTTRPATGQVTSFDPATGRGVLSVTQGANTGFLNSAVFYLYDVGAGFIIDADPTTPAGTPVGQQVTNKAYSGTLSPQAAGPFGNQSLSGNVISVSGASAIPSIPDILTALNLPSGGGAFTAIADVASLDSQIGNSPNRTFSDDYQLLDTTLGHGSATLPPGYFADFNLNQQAPATFYLIGPNQFVLIGTLSGSESGVAFFDPD